MPRAIEPLLRLTVNLRSAEELAALGERVSALRDEVRAKGMKVGIALHRWLEADCIELVLFPGTPAAKTEAEALLLEGFDVGFPDVESAVTDPGPTA
ncbi:MAG: hypothetical protein VKO21_11815 [Candidatus Sericytochromatia bacterium]|nr:hypothetical protein [Candidatus Sericytochromatia bacterium]